MTDIELVKYCLLIALGMMLSFLFSGLEIGSYSLNRVRLQVLEHQNHASAHTLRRLFNRPSVLLGTLLIGNNIANWLIASSLTYLMEDRGYSDLQVILLNVLIITPVLFVLCETLPKDLFSAHSDRLMYPLARFLHAVSVLLTLCGALPLVRGYSYLLMRLLGSRDEAHAFHPRRQVGMLVKEGVGRGVISDEQSAIAERVLGLSAFRLEDVMQPWDRIIKVNIDDPPEVIWDLADRTSRSRFPMVDTAGLLMGVISVYDVLLHEKDKCPPLRELMKPAVTLPRSMPLREGLAWLQKNRTAMAIVTEPRGRPVGVVTVKDLIEPITGELASW